MSVSPATPSERSTDWQNWWVVAMVAASKSASAPCSRARRRGDLVVVDAGQEPEQPVVGARRGRVGQRTLGLDELLADPLAELLAGRPAEGDHQHLVEAGVPLGDVARDQRADGVGLAGAGARLQQRGAGRQLAEQVEGASELVVASLIGPPP